ncbi:branched-chain amino acid ABC transporter permease [Caproiciproducens sp.]
MQQIIQVVISGLLAGGVYSLISVGLTLTFGVVGMVNFAHGEFLMLAMYISFWSFNLLNLDPYQSLLINIVLMALIALFMFKVVFERVLSSEHSIQTILTLGLSMLLQNFALMIWKADYRNVRIPINNETLNLGGIVLSLPRIIAFVIAIGLSVLLYVFLQKTYTGAAMRAISQNTKSAQLMGIELKKTYLLAFVIGIVLVGVAGSLLMPMYPASPTIGNTFCTLAFIVVVIGGLSSVPGAIFGGLLVGVIESLAGYFIGPAYQQAAYFVLFIIVLLVKPTGLFGKLST